MKKVFISVLLLISSVILFGQEKPNTVSPFDDGIMLKSNSSGGGSLIGGIESLTTPNALTAAGDRLVATQYSNGGWGWPLIAPPTYGNIHGPIAMGLAKAYLATNSATQKAALLLAGSYFLTKTNNFSPSDGYLAKQLDLIFNVNTYTNHVKTNFYDQLAAGTYNRNGLGTFYNTAGYVNLIRTSRSGAQANLAAWDIAVGLVAASMCGTSTSDWIAGVKAEIDELDGDNYYDVIGLAGALYGLAFVGEEFDPTAGEHAAASNLSDLANILVSYQVSSGGFTWNSNYLGSNDGTNQETAYAILALDAVNRSLYLENIKNAAGYLRSVQLGTGGWDGYVGDPDGENNEITGEASWAIQLAGFDLYLSSLPSIINGNVFPNNDWPLPWLAPGAPPPTMPIGYPGDNGVDWGFKAPAGFYIVPEVGSQFSACDIVIEWDNSIYSFVGLDNDGIFAPYPLAFQVHQLGQTSRITINASILPSPSDPDYFTIGSGDYIAKLNFNIIKIGHGPVSFFDIDFRKYDGAGGFSDVYFLPCDARVKSYLGDVVQTTPHDSSTGDGKVNFDDLTSWSASYWSGVPGYVPGMFYYKAKYDIGPTSTTTVYGMPTTDGKIQFEDLVIFSMSYGLSMSNVYPKVAPVPETPVEVAVGQAIASGNNTIVPVYISGAVQDLRAASLVLSGSFGKFITVEKGELLNSYPTPVMVMSRSDGNNVFVDLSIVGADVKGLNQEGQLVLLTFEGKANVRLTSADLRNTANSTMLVKLGDNTGGIPTEFGLSQNYPNPFNPATVISYQVPVQSAVLIDVFNSIGEKVTTLVNEVKEPGYYEVTWNAASLTSGVYFFRINAGDFSAVKKMMYMK